MCCHMLDCNMAKMSIFWICLAVLFGHQVNGCGITTHLELALRASSYFNTVDGDGVDYGQLMDRHQDAFQGSTSFADAFYNGLCRGGAYHSISEDTHWTPFMNVTINYIREVYPKPWSRSTEKLVVFLLGIISHQVSDATWHSLGIDQGFIRTMGATNFHGSFGDAHNHGDFGGDVMNVFGMETDWIGTIFKWYIPTDDMVEIYRRYYGYEAMPADVIDDCVRWMYLGRWGEQLGVIEILSPYYAAFSPFLADRLQDYFLGGMDDMAVWTANVWKEAIHMLEHGTETCELTENPIYINCNRKVQESSQPEKRSAVPRVGMQHPDTLAKFVHGLLLEDVVVERTEKGIYLTPGQRIKDLWRAREERKAAMNSFLASETQSNATSDSTLGTDIPYSRAGTSMVSGDVNGDGFEDLVIGAPGHSSNGNFQQGRVYVVLGSEDGLGGVDKLNGKADIILDGPELNGRFGQSVALVDMNADGITDIAVGAPQVGSPELNYNGEVYVYFGQPGGVFSDKPAITIGCSQRYCNFGWSLAGSDVNGDDVRDLVIGAPYAPAGGEQRGLVGSFYSKPQFNDVIYIDEKSFDWVVEGDQDYGWLGFDLDAAGQWVVAGAPTYRICALAGCEWSDDDVQSVGRVSVYRSPLVPQAHATITGTRGFGQLGAEVALNKDGSLLAIGAMSESVGDLNLDQPGQVTLYDVKDDVNIDPVASFTGEAWMSRFGASIQLGDVNGDGADDAIIGAPFFSGNFAERAEEGRAYIFYSQSPGSLRGHYKASNADLTLLTGEGKSRFGSAIAMVRGTTHTQVAVSGIHSDRNARLSGIVEVFNL